MNTKNRLLWFLLLNEIFDNSIIVLMWHLHDCSQVTLVGLFPDETDTTVLKWDWYDGSQVTLGPMLPIDVVTIVPKWHWHDCSQADFDFLILFCFLVCSLARFFTSNFSLDFSLVSCTRIIAHYPKIPWVSNCSKIHWFFKSNPPCRKR